MALFLAGLRILVAPSGYHRIQKKKIYYVWSNEEAESLPFDILSNKAWKNYLRKFKLPNGKLLPRKSDQGEIIAYVVFFYGVPKWAKDLPNTKGGYLNLFPGKDKYGNKLYVWKYGRLDL